MREEDNMANQRKSTSPRKKTSSSGSRGTGTRKKKASSGKTASRGNKKKTTNTKSIKRTGTPTRARGPQEPVEKQGIDMGMEIQLIVSFGLMVLLMLSNFGMGGTAGKMISSFFFGLFGCVQYVMPLLFFLGITLLVANDYSSFAMKKFLAAFLMLMMISAYVQLFHHNTDINLYDLFSIALQDRTTGGLIGGGFAIVLKKWFSLPGALVIISCIFLLSAIMLTQKSVTEFFRKAMASIRLFFADQKSFREARRIKGEERRKSAQDKVREKQCEDKVKELEEKRMEARRKAEEEQTLSQEEKEPEFYVPTFQPSDEVKRKDAVKELHPEIYPFSQEDGKTTPFEKELDFTAFSFNTDKSPEDFAREIRENTLTREQMEERIRNAQSIYSKGVREIEAPPEEEVVISLDAISEETVPDDTSPEDLPDEMKAENGFEDVTIRGAGPMNPDQEIQIHKEEPGKEKTGRRSYTKKKAEGEDYVFPPVGLLSKGDKTSGDENDEFLKATARKLQETLYSFGVNVKITDISYGPTVTRYEMVPEQGTKVSKIVSLSDDIKLNLAATDIRIEAPIPGKSAIGIEVPNKHTLTVHFRDLIESSKFCKFRSRLAFAVGKDIGGQTVITDIDKMPHLLIAGATGSGKSVCINTLIMSLLYKARPDEVKLILIDPKMVELSVYNGIPHLLIPVVTDPKKASGALNWAVAEMTDRYKKFTENGVRNIQGYNEKVKQILATEGVDAERLKPMPRIVVIIDELADLMMVASGEVEEAIVRLSQLARAAGIHLVIATQRPSVNVITGLIKANIPSRIAFEVSSGVDSRTIIDMNGAEKLLGKGDMLFYPAGMSKPSRIQGAFVSDNEVASVVEFLKENEEVAVYDEGVSESIVSTMAGSNSSVERDEYFADAARFLLEKDKASIGMLQRMFKIGFNRAARIMDQLADAGIVGPEEGTKPRKILMSPEQLEQYLEEYL